MSARHTVFSKIHRSNINKFSDFTAMNFLESVIAMNFQPTTPRFKTKSSNCSNPPV